MFAYGGEGGGYKNEIDKSTFASDTNHSDVGDITTGGETASGANR